MKKRGDYNTDFWKDAEKKFNERELNSMAQAEVESWELGIGGGLDEDGEPKLKWNGFGPHPGF